MKISGLFRKYGTESWKFISNMKHLDKIQEDSFSRPQIIFKHSTRCSISSMAKNRLEDGLTNLQPIADLHYLDLLSFRNISNEIASRFKVDHESPQVIIIINGMSVYHQSHHMINVDEMLQLLSNLNQ